MSIAVLFIVLFALILIGVPVAVALGVSSLVCMILFTSHDISGVPDIFISAFKPTLMAIPMFILAGSHPALPNRRHRHPLQRLVAHTHKLERQI